MLEIKIKNNNLKNNDFLKIINFLNLGKILVLPTDTIYGFSARADIDKGIKKIKRIKKRGKDKPFILLVSDVKMLKKYVFLSKNQEAILKNIWFKNKRPSTVILNSRNNLSPELKTKDSSLALRLPKSDFLIKIIKELDVPIVSTSLNFSGQEPILNLELIKNNYFEDKLKPNLLVNKGISRTKRSSRLIDLRGDKIIIIRK